MEDNFMAALCQMQVTADKKANIEKACNMICEASSSGASLAVLPEMFNSPYSNAVFGEYAEPVEGGETIGAIRDTARTLGMYVVAGSIPEISGGKLYNTSVAVGPNGGILGIHRKMHLFDIDVPGRITFRESDVLSRGNNVTVIETKLCRIGMAICYDMRFPELIRLMALDGANLVVVPAAFNMVTGPAHWEPLIRLRAIDNQVYMAVASPARDERASYVAYGHSMVVDPWGSIVTEAGTGEGIQYAEIRMNEVERIRNELPLLRNRRTDIYTLEEKRIKKS